MFFSSFSGGVGRVVIGTVIGLLSMAGTMKVIEWAPQVTTFVSDLL